MEQSTDIGITTQHLDEIKCVKCGKAIDVAEVPSFSVLLCPYCSHEQTVPGRFGSFLLLELLGTGGMGGVFRAHDESLGRDVAIKVMQRKLGDSSEFVENFRREAQAAAKLNHPHIAQIYSFGQVDGQPFIVMELVPGKPFDKMIDDHSPLDPALVMQIGADIADGLLDAADIGLTHGDIKPENILLDDKDNAKLVDFGIASFANAQNQNEIWGTPYYIAPERVKKRRLDARSDIYCLGATLYHALTGSPPFEGETPTDVIKARFEGPPPAPSTVREDLPASIDPVIMRMLEEEPARRYPTYKSLLGDMRRVMEGLGPALGTRRSSRVVIRSKRSPDAAASTTGSISKSGTTSSGGIRIQRGSLSSGPPPTTSSVAAPVANKLTSNGTKKQKSVKPLIVTISILLVIVWVVGGIVLVNSLFGGDKEWLPEPADKGLTAESQQAKAAAEALVAALKPVASLAEDARGVLDEATNLYFGATGRLPQQPFLFEELSPAGEPSDSDESATSSGDAEQVLQREYDAIAASVGSVLSMESQAAEATQRVATFNADLSGMTSVAEIVAAREEFESAQAKITEQIESARSAIDSARLRLIALKSAADEMARKQEIAERERLEAEALARKEAEERRLREERARKIRDEKAGVEAAVAQRQDLFARNRYEQIARELRTVRLELETEEAKATLDLAVGRYEALVLLRETITTTLEKNPLKRGWTEQGRRFDVVKGDKLFLYLGDGRRVLWEEVDAAHMVPLIQHICSEQEVDRKERFNRLLAAAAYCFEAARTNPRAMPMAKAFAEQAVELRPSQRVPTQKLLPGLLDDE